MVAGAAELAEYGRREPDVAFEDRPFYQAGVAYARPRDFVRWCRVRPPHTSTRENFLLGVRRGRGGKGSG